LLITILPNVELQVPPELSPIPLPDDELNAVTIEFEIAILSIVDSPYAKYPPPIPDPKLELAVIVEFPITIRPILEDVCFFASELQPDPIPDPPFDVAELLAVTNEFKISHPEMIEYPPVNEPPPIPDPIVESSVELVLASTRESRIRIKPVIEPPLATDPVPIPDAPSSE
jgi:hypothetical protein